MKKDKLLQAFLLGANLASDTDDTSVAIGTVRPIDCPDGVKQVIKEHIELIDKLIDVLPDGKQKYELQTLRGFSFSEYQDLFNPISEQSFQDFAIFRYLWIQREEDRRRLIYKISKTSYEDYTRLLLRSFQVFHAFRLTSFFLALVPNSAYQAQRFTRSNHRQNRKRQVKAFGADVRRYAKKIAKEQKAFYGNN